MKSFFTTGSILFTFLILILAFENIGGAKFQSFLFFFVWLDQSINPFFIVIGIAILGGITGMFYSGLISELIRNKDNDEPAANDW